MGLQLIRSLVLTHLLFPEAFGLMALVGVVMQGLQMCSDVGIGPSVIQSRRGEDVSFLQTAWTVQILRAGLLWLVACALAWPASVLYGEPLLVLLLPAGGLSTLLGGLRSISWTVCDRNMRQDRLTLVSLGTSFVNLFVMVLLAWWLRSVWALVWGQLVGVAITVGASHLYLPAVPHRLRWDPAAVRELVHFGKWIFVSTLLTFFAMQTDRLLLGKLIPLGVLGVYSIALVLASLPRDILLTVSSAVLFPAQAQKVRQDPRGTSAVFGRMRAALLRAGLLLALGVGVAAPVFFRLYDARYHDAAWMAQLLAISAWVTILSATSGSALLALGDSRTLALGNLANLCVTVAGGLGGFYLAGLPGFIIGFALGTAAGELVQGRRLRQHGLGVLRQDLRYSGLGLLFGGLYIGGVSLLQASEAGSLWLEAGYGLIVWVCLGSVTVPQLLRELRPELARFTFQPWRRGGPAAAGPLQSSSAAQT